MVKEAGIPNPLDALLLFSAELHPSAEPAVVRHGVKTIDLLFEESTLTIEDIAERARLTVARVEAIALGRWTPSPTERQRIADAFGVEVENVSWGHSMDPRNIRYRRFGLKENF